MESEGTQYYWCVNCGHCGDYGFKRLIALNCQNCKYDAVTPYSLEEIKEDETLSFKFRDVVKNENPAVS